MWTWGSMKRMSDPRAPAAAVKPGSRPVLTLASTPRSEPRQGANRRRGEGEGRPGSVEPQLDACTVRRRSASLVLGSAARWVAESTGVELGLDTPRERDRP